MLRENSFVHSDNCYSAITRTVSHDTCYMLILNTDIIQKFIKCYRTFQVHISDHIAYTVCCKLPVAMVTMYIVTILTGLTNTSNK